jgi:hypothetical protein
MIKDENGAISSVSFLLTKVSAPALETLACKKLSRALRQTGGDLIKKTLLLTEDL